jgi:hypothetical protein
VEGSAVRYIVFISPLPPQTSHSSNKGISPSKPIGLSRVPVLLQAKQRPCARKKSSRPHGLPSSCSLSRQSFTSASLPWNAEYLARASSLHGLPRCRISSETGVLISPLPPQTSHASNNCTSPSQPTDLKPIPFSLGTIPSALQAAHNPCARQ